MTTDIFLRTYHGDVGWLKYFLRSVQKYCSGVRKVIITIPDDQVDSLKPLNLTSEVVIPVKGYKNDYLGQQITKLQCFMHSDADMLLMCDSDNVYFQSFTPESYMRDGKPIFMMTPYEQVGNAQCWKPITEKAVGFEVQYEYMRRLPALFHRSSFEEIWNHLKQTLGDPEHYISTRPNREFSEYNCLGAYIHKFCADQYHLLDTSKDPLPEKFCEQFWSWGGITPEVKEHLEKFLYS